MSLVQVESMEVLEGSPRAGGDEPHGYGTWENPTR